MSSVWREYFYGFDNPAEEKLFNMDYYRKLIVQIRIGFVVSIFIYLIFYFIDDWVFADIEHGLLLNRIVICTILSLIFFASYTDFFKQHLQSFLLYFGVIATAGILWKLWFLNLNGYDFSFFYPGLILTTGIVTFYLRVRFVQAALLNIITILSYILLYAFFIREVPSGSQISLNQIFVNSLFFIICSSFLSLYGAYYLEKFTRNDFLIRSEIEHLNNNLEALVDQRTAELEEEKQKNIRLLLEGQEKERERIAKELHDGVCNQLALLKLDLEHQIQKQDFSRISESLESILKINQEVRDISHNQSTYTLQKHGLQKAVENSVHQLINKHDIRFNVHFHNIGNSICETTQLMLYRVFQESVNNILKHSGATEVDIQLMQHENELNLTIYDNGRGFNKNLVNGSGLGLHNMQLRIEQQCNGKLIVDSQPDYGTTIIVNIDNS